MAQFNRSNRLQILFARLRSLRLRKTFTAKIKLPNAATKHNPKINKSILTKIERKPPYCSFRTVLYRHKMDMSRLLENFCYNVIMRLLFAENLKSLRESENLRQRELAKKLNATQSRISNWENGLFEPDLENLWKIADLFEISIDELIGRKEF